MDVKICFEVCFIVILIEKYVPYFMYFALQCKHIKKFRSNRSTKTRRHQSKFFCM